MDIKKIDTSIDNQKFEYIDIREHRYSNTAVLHVLIVNTE